MIDPYICEQKKGCIANSEDQLSARQKGIEVLAVVKTTGSQKVMLLKWLHLQRSQRSRCLWL